MNFSGGAITLNADLVPGSTAAAPAAAIPQSVYMTQPEVSLAEAARLNKAAKAKENSPSQPPQ
jgi:hypothetical protein